jgi:hypothetical protein
VSEYPSSAFPQEPEVVDSRDAEIARLRAELAARDQGEATPPEAPAEPAAPPEHPAVVAATELATALSDAPVPDNRLITMAGNLLADVRELVGKL